MAALSAAWLLEPAGSVLDGAAYEITGQTVLKLVP
jgi:hypothetical protein